MSRHVSMWLGIAVHYPSVATNKADRTQQATLHFTSSSQRAWTTICLTCLQLCWHAWHAGHGTTAAQHTPRTPTCMPHNHSYKLPRADFTNKGLRWRLFLAHAAGYCCCCCCKGRSFQSVLRQLLLSLYSLLCTGCASQQPSADM